MKTITIREFSRNVYGCLENLPITVTRNGTPMFVVSSVSENTQGGGLVEIETPKKKLVPENIEISKGGIVKEDETPKKIEDSILANAMKPKETNMVVRCKHGNMPSLCNFFECRKT